MEKHVGWDADMFLSDIEQYVERFQIFVLSDVEKYVERHANIFLSDIETYVELDADIFLQRYRKTCQTHRHTDRQIGRHIDKKMDK